MKGVYGYVAASLLGIFAAFSWLDANEAREKRRAAESALRAKTVETAKWKARYAEAATHVTTRTDTVRVRVTKYQTLRDSVVITDTVIQKLVYAADSAIAECVNLATACEVLRVRADSLIEALTIERDGWRRIYEKAAYPPWWRTRCGLYLGYGAVRAGREVFAGPSVAAGCRVFP